MGHKTYKSIGHPLVGRTNIIISHGPDISNCRVFNDLNAVLKFSQNYAEVVIIGGVAIYKMFFPYVKQMNITQIHAKFEGNIYFPDYIPEQWQIVEQQDYLADTKNAYPYSFITLRRL
jgi:dihydrofolate reductase